MQFTVLTDLLAESTRLASRIAPTRGDAFDKASGFLIEASDIPDHINLRATDLNTQLTRRIPAKDIDIPEGATARLPAHTLATLAGTLPSDTDAEFSLDGAEMRLMCDSVDVTLRTITGYFPTFASADGLPMADVPDLGAAIKQVSWAADRGGRAPLDGVNIDGTWLSATNRHQFARVKCEVPVDEPITVPLTSLAHAIGKATDVKMCAADGRLHIRPDEYTELNAVIYAEKYPSMQILDDYREGADKTAAASGSDFGVVLSRMQAVSASQRIERAMKVALAEGVLTLSSTVPDLGEISDAFEIECDVNLTGEWHFNPDLLASTLAVLDDDEFELRFSLEAMKPWFVIQGDYEGIVMPRRVM